MLKILNYLEDNLRRLQSTYLEN